MIGGFENLVDVNAAGDVVFVGIISYGVAGSTRGVLVAERFFPLPVPASGPIGLAVLCLVLAAAGCSRVGRR